MKEIQAPKVAAIKSHRTVRKKDTYFQMITKNSIHLGLLLNFYHTFHTSCGECLQNFSKIGHVLQKLQLLKVTVPPKTSKILTSGRLGATVSLYKGIENKWAGAIGGQKCFQYGNHSEGEKVLIK